MKGMVFFIIIYSFFLAPTFLASELTFKDIQENAKKHPTGRIFILTYQRSGTHWMFYILQSFTKRPIIFARSEIKELGLDVDNNKPLIINTHRVLPFLIQNNGFIKPCNFKKDKILVIIRNPLESFIRHLQIANNIPIDSIPDYLRKENYNLYENLQFFEKWPKENRHLLYYEDLLKDPRTEIRKTLRFLGESDKDLDRFIENIDMHIENSLKNYDRIQGYSGGSVSRGEDLKFHSRDLPVHLRDEICEVLSNKNPYLFQKYLQRYFK